MLLRRNWDQGNCYSKGREEYLKHVDFSSIPFAGAAVRRSGAFEIKDVSSRVQSEERDV